MEVEVLFSDHEIQITTPIIKDMDYIKNEIIVWIIKNNEDYLSDFEHEIEANEIKIKFDMKFNNSYESAIITKINHNYYFNIDTDSNEYLDIFIKSINSLIQNNYGITCSKILDFIQEELPNYNSDDSSEEECQKEHDVKQTNDISKDNEEYQEEQDVKSDNNEEMFGDFEEEYNPFNEFINNEEESINLIKLRKERLWKEQAEKLYQEGGYDIDKALFEKDAIIQLIINEINEINEDDSGIEIHIIDDNIFNFKVKYTSFDSMDLSLNLIALNDKYGYSHVEFDIKLNRNLYPHYPPEITFIKPKLLNGLDYAIFCHDYFKVEKWNLTNSLKFTLISIRNWINKYGKIDPSNDLNYLEIENYIFKLSTLTKIEYNNGYKLDIDFITLNDTNVIKNDKSSYWAAGTGYGGGNKTADWDIKKYIQTEKNKADELAECLKNIYKSFLDFIGSRNNGDIYKNIIHTSCLIHVLSNIFSEATLLEIENKVSIYDNTSKILEVLTNKYFSDLIDSTKLYETIKISLEKIYKECKLYCSKSNSETDVDIVYNRIIDSYESMSDITKITKNDVLSKVWNNDDLKNIISEVLDNPDLENIIRKYISESNESSSTKIKQCFSDNSLSNKFYEFSKLIIGDIRIIIDKDFEFKNIKEFLLKKIQNEKCFLQLRNYILQNYQQKFYIYVLKEYIYQDKNIINYSYKDNDRLSTRNGTMRLLKEIASFESSLPILYSTSIFVVTTDENMQKMKCLITGPEDTPYSNGCFIFDIYIPSNYPNEPPKFNLVTTGNGTVRFNPNLYNCGKVCLSLLGTWSGQQGESWNAETSTLLQVFISIQSLILIDEPYFNEPGYEKTRGNENGNKISKDYNDNIRYETFRWGIINNIKKPQEEFKDVILNHFRLKKDKILEEVEKWKSETKIGADKYDVLIKEFKQLVQ